MGHEPPSLRAWTQDPKEASVHTSVLGLLGLLGFRVYRVLVF